jgi:hypothetical protein
MTLDSWPVRSVTDASLRPPVLRMRNEALECKDTVCQLTVVANADAFAGAAAKR